VCIFERKGKKKKKNALSYLRRNIVIIIFFQITSNDKLFFYGKQSPTYVVVIYNTIVCQSLCTYYEQVPFSRPCSLSHLLWSLVLVQPLQFYANHASRKTNLVATWQVQIRSMDVDHLLHGLIKKQINAIRSMYIV